MGIRPGHRALALLLPVLAMLLAIADHGMAASPSSPSDMDTLIPQGTGMLDRLAYGVDGAESGHGTNPRMWRSELDRPQGPMQVSTAAAVDAGGGDRFDEQQNRALGRAYRARMYRRYGSWGDAIAAYNWGPGNMDGWIDGGRKIEKFPPAVANYQSRVLVGSRLLAAAGGGANVPVGLPVLQRGIVHMQPRRPLADQRRRSGSTDEVELLYIKIMRATDPNNR